MKCPQQASVAMLMAFSLTSLAHADINVPVTKVCDANRAPTAYLAKSSGSTATWPLLTAPARMTPCLIKTDLGSSEPSLAIRRDGTLLYAPVHFANGDIGVMRSKDQGATWDATVPRLPSGAPHSRVQPVMFMEPESERIFFHTSRASFKPLAIKTGLDLNISDDGGDTWHYRPVDEFKGLDWVKYAAGVGKTSTPIDFPKVLYMSGPTPISTPAVLIVPKVHQVLKSLDGGETWQDAGGFDIQLLSNKCALTEYILMGSSAVAADGTLYIAGRRCAKVALATSKDEGKTWSVMDVPNTKLITGATTVAVAGNPNYVLTQPLTLDSQGNLYVLYADESNILRLTISRNKGATWSTPVVVSAPTVKRTHLAGLTIKAPGKIAIAYYGTEGSATTGAYNMYVAESSNAFSATPTFKSQVLNAPSDPVAATGFDANYLGMFIGGDLAELTELQYDPNGDLFISLVQDMCPSTLSCNWDFKAHNSSKFRAVVGRITH